MCNTRRKVVNPNLMFILTFHNGLYVLFTVKNRHSMFKIQLKIQNVLMIQLSDVSSYYILLHEARHLY